LIPVWRIQGSGRNCVHAALHRPYRLVQVALQLIYR